MSEWLFNFIEVIVETLFDIDSNATVWIGSPPYTTKKFISYSFYMGEVITKLDDIFWKSLNIGKKVVTKTTQRLKNSFL